MRHHPAKIGSMMHCSSWDIMVLVCHVIQQDHVHKISHHPTNFGGNSHFGTGNIMAMFCQVT